ncbi:MAG: DMT family transporter [Desulfobacteraceae bacterium]|nr:MAG: DMT family transporter [Desulfobacteraceae bacterium]
MKNSTLRPILALITAMILWASSFVALKFAIRFYDPMIVIFGRMMVASVFFLLIAYQFKTLEWKTRDLKWIAVMVLFEPCLYFLFEIRAIENTTASQAGMITAVLPLLVAIGARIFLKEYLHWQTIAGFVISISGAVWLSMGGSPSQSAPNPLLGNFFEFLAMLCATGYTLILKRLTAFYPPLFLTGIQAIAGSLFYLPFLFLPSTTLPHEFHPIPFAAILYLGVFITLGAYGLYNYGVSRISAGKASAFVNLIPVFAVVLGWLILSERFTVSQYLASGCVLIGVLISQFNPMRVKK